MCDVKKIRLKGRMRGEVGKETPKKRWIFYDVAHDTSGILLFVQKFVLTNQDFIKVPQLLRQRMKNVLKSSSLTYNPISQEIALCRSYNSLTIVCVLKIQTLKYRFMCFIFSSHPYFK